MIELVRFRSANYSNYYFRYAIDDDTVSVIKCATNSISVDGDNVKSSRCSLITPTIFNSAAGFDDCVSAFAFTAITDKQYDMYLQLSTDQETWTNFSSQLSLTFYNNGTEYIGCLPSLSSELLTGAWGSTIENGITIVSTHENIIQNNTVLTEQQWYALIASDPKEYIWKVQSPDGKIYHIRDAEAKEILDNIETFEVDVDSHVLHINGDSAAGGGSMHTYSTTEQVVGTWIDGKPVYEKTYDLNMLQINQQWTTSSIIEPIDKVIKADLIDEYNQHFTCEVGLSETSTSGYYSVELSTRDPASYNRRFNYLIMEYTKTTD